MHLGVPVCTAAHPAPAALSWGKEPTGEAAHSSGTNPPQAGGEKREQIFQEPNCTIPIRPKFKAFQQSNQEPPKKKMF